MDNWFSVYIYILLMFILVFWIYFSFFFKRKTWISESKKEYFYSKISDIEDYSSSDKEKILEFDKLYHHILKEFWYNWSFWEILKRNPKEILDINLIWRLHKIRNKLAHEFDTFSESDLSKDAKLFQKEVEKLLQNTK